MVRFSKRRRWGYDKALRLFIFGVVTKPVEPQLSFGFGSIFKFHLIENAGSVIDKIQSKA